MNRERYQRVKAVFAAARELDEPARSALLEARCGDDVRLRRDVLRLLEVDDEDDELVPSLPSRALPDRIGAYRPIDILGAGGMGIVYLAEQDDPRRKVALKVIRPGFVTEGLLRRFRTEARVLGRLQHPGIAQIFEAGTAEVFGEVLPFFVMEHVRGRPIDQVAATLAPDARIELLARVCDAVGHAHENGVVHRDLKPGNVLVDDTGQVKVLDFGIARVLEAHGETLEQTATGQLLGTLPYMSPEQTTGAAIDPRSDVYSLGVVAYELLTGALPHAFAGKSFTEAVRLIADEDVLPLGAVDRRYKGDLETIVGRALEKDRDRRYSSATDLANDLRRSLRHEPIVARPPSRAYLVRKFARRHRAVVGGAFGIALVLIAGTIVALLFAADARDEARRASREARLASMVADFLVGTFESADPYVTRGEEVSARDLLDRAAQNIESALAAEPSVQARMLRTIGRAYVRLGAYDAGAPLLDRSIELYRARPGIDRLDLADGLDARGQIHMVRGEYTEAEPLFIESLEIRRRSSDAETNDVGLALQRLGALACKQNRTDEGLLLLAQAVRSQRESLDPAQPWRRQALAQALEQLGASLLGAGQLRDAVAALEESIEIREGQFGPLDPNLLASVGNLGIALWYMNRLEEAESPLLRCLEIGERSNPDDDLGHIRRTMNLAGLYSTQGRVAEARARMEGVLPTWERLDLAVHPELAGFPINLARLDQQLGDLESARARIESALRVFEELLPADHPQVGMALMNLADVDVAEGDDETAEALIRRAVSIYRKNYGDDSVYCADAERQLAWICLRADREDEALELFSHSAEVERAQNENWEAVLDDLITRLRDAQESEAADRLMERTSAWRTTLDP